MMVRCKHMLASSQMLQHIDEHYALLDSVTNCIWVVLFYHLQGHCQSRLCSSSQLVGTRNKSGVACRAWLQNNKWFIWTKAFTNSKNWQWDTASVAAESDLTQQQTQTESCLGGWSTCTGKESDKSRTQLWPDYLTTLLTCVSFTSNSRGHPG